MKHNKATLSRDPNFKSELPPLAVEFNRNEDEFSPSADEISRKAYFSFVNQGSPAGQSVQHWLAAEAELIAERNRTRTHGFHNRS
jgi:hypothetical protein